MKHIPQNVKGENPFSVPKGYFERNQIDFLDLVKDLESERKRNITQATVIPLKRRALIWGSSAAAAIMLLLIFVYTFQKTPLTTNQNNWLAEITPSDALAYMLEEGDMTIDVSEEDWSLEILTDIDLDSEEELEEQIIIDEIVDDFYIYDL